MTYMAGEWNGYGLQYRILHGNWLIADISSKPSKASFSCVVTFPDIRNELLVLMLAITLAAAGRVR